MTRQSKLIILVAYLLILAIVMLGYRSDRAKKVKQLKAQISQVAAEQEKTRRGESELARLSKLIPAEVNSSAVVESLYRYAKESGLKEHALATDADKKQTGARPGVSKESGTVTSTGIKVSVAGSYRQIAEYIRRVQNMERFNRITEFKFSPDDAGIKGTLIIEIYSLAVKP